MLLAGATAPTPLPVQDQVEADLWDQLPPDLPELLALLPHADLYLQDEMQRHFQALAQTPAAVLRHLGSPFAPHEDQDAPLPLAQAA